jgi:hypothetical protein
MATGIELSPLTVVSCARHTWPKCDGDRCKDRKNVSLELLSVRRSAESAGITREGCAGAGFRCA